MGEKKELYSPKNNEDATDLLEKAMEILRKEINFLHKVSIRGKLQKEEAADLVRYVILLKDIKKDEDLELSELSDVELQKKINDLTPKISKRTKKKVEIGQ